jgi:hypothetical protein
LSDDNFSSVLRQAISLSFEDQVRLIECLKQQLETTSHDPLETLSSCTHSAEVQPATQEQVTADREVDDNKSHLDFMVEDGLYGKLICSYHLEEVFLYSLDVFFSDVFAKQKFNVNHAIMCREEALRLLREKIKRNIQDAMEGLIYEVRLQVLRSFNGWYFFIDFNPTEQLQGIREFYICCVNDRTNARQGRGQRREEFLRKITAAYARAAEKANKKATAAAKAHKNASPGRYGIRLEDWRVIDRKREFYGVVTKAALAREMELAGHRISQSVLSRQMRRYKVEVSDLDKIYDDERIARERE